MREASRCSLVLSIPLQHLIDRAEIGFDLLRFPRPEVALGKHEETRFLEPGASAPL